MQRGDVFRLDQDNVKGLHWRWGTHKEDNELYELAKDNYLVLQVTDTSVFVCRIARVSDNLVMMLNKHIYEVQLQMIADCEIVDKVYEDDFEYAEKVSEHLAIK